MYQWTAKQMSELHARFADRQEKMADQLEQQLLPLTPASNIDELRNQIQQYRREAESHRDASRKLLDNLGDHYTWHEPPPSP